MKRPPHEAVISVSPDRTVIPVLDPESVHAGLSPNRHIRTGLFLRSVDSTNHHALEMVRNRTATAGMFVCAEEQTAGCGRRGRAWWSPPHLNLYVSVLLKKSFPASDLFLVTAICAAAVREALSACCGIPADLKWPNDVMVRGRKIAGVLVETESDFLVAGIGLNVNMDPALSVDLERTATSVLSETGKDHPREALLVRLLTGIETRYSAYPDRKDEIFTEWASSLVWPKRIVKVRTPDATFRGRLTGVMPDGRAVLRTSAGAEVGVLPESDRI